MSKSEFVAAVRSCRSSISEAILAWASDGGKRIPLLLAATAMVLAGVAAPGNAGGPPTVNLQVDVEQSGDELTVYNILRETESRGWYPSVYVSGEFAELHGEVVRDLHSRGCQICVHGWQVGEDLTSSGYLEQRRLIDRALQAVRNAVGNTNPDYINDVRPQGYRQNETTFEVLRDMGVRSNSGFIALGGALSHPYHTEWGFVAVPIATVHRDDGDIPLDDSFIFGSSSGAAPGASGLSEALVRISTCEAQVLQQLSDAGPEGLTPEQYFDLLNERYEEVLSTNDPISLVVHASVVGSDPRKLDAFARFLDRIGATGGRVVNTDYMTTIANPYIGGVSLLALPRVAEAGDNITLFCGFNATCYCPTYKFRAYGTYEGSVLDYLGEYSVYAPSTGWHFFILRFLLPHPPTGQDTYHIRLVARAAHGGGPWPTYSDYEVMAETSVQVRQSNVRIVRLEAYGDVAIRDIGDIVWEGTFDEDGNLIDVQMRPIADAMNSPQYPRYFNLNCALDGFPSRPEWTPTVNCHWEMLDSNGRSRARGNARFAGWDGMIQEVRVPPAVGQYLLVLSFTISREGVAVHRQEMTHLVYVTYDLPLPEDRTPKEVWLSTATRWASGATVPLGIARSLNSGIYTQSRWVYRPELDDRPASYWETLVEGGPGTPGHCLHFATAWAELSKVLGVNPTTDRYSPPGGFITITPAIALDTTPGNIMREASEVMDRWVFGMHTVGCYLGSYYDPTFGNRYSGRLDYIEWHFNGNIGADARGRYWEFGRPEDYARLYADPPYANHYFRFHGAATALFTMSPDEHTRSGEYPLLTAGYAGGYLPGKEPVPVLGAGSGLATAGGLRLGYRAPMGSATVPRAATVGTAGFTGVYSQAGMDTDADGIYNHLSADVEIDVTVPGDLLLTGFLARDDSVVTFRSDINATLGLSYELTLGAGLDTVNVQFSGEDIYARGFDGPYTVHLTLMDSSYAVLDTLEFLTSSYSHGEFGETPGRLAAAHDSLEDIDGDGLADYLVADVEFDVTLPMTYAVAASLTADSTLIASAGQSLSCGVGHQAVALRFKGTDIRKSAIDGPYSIEIMLYDESNSQIDNSTSSSSDYLHTVFESPAVGFTGVFSDHGTDSSGNGLFDSLAVEVGLDVATAGSFKAEGWLKDSTGQDVCWAAATIHLDSGMQTLSLSFAGSSIRKHGFDGPYTLSHVAIYTTEDSLLNDLADAYTTSPYSFPDFDAPAAEFGGSYGDHGTDSNGDGLFDYLTVEADVLIEDAGQYTVYGVLSGAGGEDIATGAAEGFFDAGAHTVAIQFDGMGIRDRGVDGPYELKHLELAAGSGEYVEVLADAYATEAYDHLEFQALSVEFTDSCTDIGTDTDADGRFNYLTANVGVEVTVPGVYRLNADLFDSTGVLICEATTGAVSLDAGPSALQLNFNGVAINRHAVDGPYQVRFATIYDEGDRQITQQADAHTTSPYGHADFDSPPLELNDSYDDYGTDSDLDGLYDYLSIEVGVVVTEAADYYVRGSLQDSTGNSIVTVGRRVSLYGGLQYVTLDFDGITIRDHGVDGPYTLSRLGVDDSTGNLVDYRSSPHMTDAYTISQFQTGGSITGEVTDTAAGPVVGAYMHLSGPSAATAYTDSSGWYSFDGLKSGTYEVYAYPPIEACLMEHYVFVNIVGGSDVTSDFVLSPAGVIIGTITDVHNDPLPGVYVNIAGYEEPYYLSNADGVYGVPSLNSGSYEVCAALSAELFSTGEYEDSTKSVTAEVTVGEITTVDFVFPPSTPPARITDLAAVDSTFKAVTLSWTAPGDDGTVGLASSYDIRYSTDPIDSANWDAAIRVTSEVPVPAEPGTNQICVVGGLGPSTGYYFGVVTRDEASMSEISNIVGAATLGAPDIEVSPDSLRVELEPGHSRTDTLRIANSGGDDLAFRLSVAPDTGGTARSNRVGFYADETRRERQQIDQLQLRGRLDAARTLDTGDVLDVYDNFPYGNTGMVWAGSDLYVVAYYDGVVYRYDTVTQRIADSIFVHGSPLGIAWDGAYLWVGDGYGNVYGYDLDGNNVGSFSTPVYSYLGITWDGQYFLVNYAFEEYSPTFYRVDYTGAVVETYTSSFGGYAYGTVWVPQHPQGNLWLTDSDYSRIAELALADGVASLVLTFGTYDADNSAYSIAHDGVDLWWADWNGPLYRIDDGIFEGSDWLSLDPTYGVVPPDSVFNIHLTFDAVGLRPDTTYAGVVQVRSDDPDEPVVAVPVKLVTLDGAYLELGTYTVDDDSAGESGGDGDAVIDPGETVELIVTLANTGSTLAAGVTATLSTADSYASVLDSLEDFGDIAAGGLGQCVDDFGLQISQSIPDGHSVDLHLVMTDAGGNAWYHEFSVVVRNLSTVSGLVYDAFDMTGIEGAVVSCEGPTSGADTTDPSGYYEFVLPPGSYSLSACSEGLLDSEPVLISVPPDTSVNFVLGVPDIEVSPDSIFASLTVGEVAAGSLVIGNTGSIDLAFRLNLANASAGLDAGHEAHRQCAEGRVAAPGFYADENRGGGIVDLPQQLPGSLMGYTLAPGDTEGVYDNFPYGNTGMVCADNGVYVVSYDNERLYRYDMAAEAVVDSFPLHDSPLGIAWDGEFFWIGDGAGNIRGYDLEGNNVGSFSCPISYYSSIAWDGEYFIVCECWADNPTFYRIDYAGNVVGSYTSSFGVYVSGMVWVEAHTDGELWINDTYAQRLVELSLDGGAATVIRSFGVGSGMSSYSIAHDGVSLLWADWDGPLYRLDDGVEEVSWLSVAPMSGAVQPGSVANIVVTFDATGLAADSVYSSYIRIRSNDPDEPRVDIPVTLEVTAGGCEALVPVAAGRWRLISFWTMPGDLDISSVLNDLERLDIAKDHDGNVYIPSVPINTIGDLNPMNGYQVFVIGEGDTCTVEGEPMNPAGIPITLRPGRWNMVSYLSGSCAPCGLPIAEAMAGVAGFIDIVKDDEGNVWIPSIPLNTIGNLVPGKGYWVFLSSDTEQEFFYPTCAAASYLSLPEAQERAASTHFRYQVTGLSCIVVVDSVDLGVGSVACGDEIGVFCGDRCVGSTVLNAGGMAVAVACWEGDPEHGLSGFSVGEEMVFRYWDNDIEQEYLLDGERSDGGKPAFDRFAYLRLSLTAGAGSLLPESFALSGCKPNPFSNAAEVRLDLPGDAPVHLDIYDIGGRLVRSTALGVLPRGTHILRWDGKDALGMRVAPGVYFVRVEAGNVIATRRLVAVR